MSYPNSLFLRLSKASFKLSSFSSKKCPEESISEWSNSWRVNVWFLGKKKKALKSYLLILIIKVSRRPARRSCPLLYGILISGEKFPLSM